MTHPTHMTNEERAREVGRLWMDGPKTFHEAVMDALATARREGAEDMRERAAMVAFVSEIGATRNEIAADIRALKVVP